MNLFARVSKVNESRQEVEGILTAEEPDREGEIFDYESSKPYFQSWSANISEATGGLSLGNVRFQHQPDSAVGKIVKIVFDDAAKAIRIVAKIVDPATWRAILEGVLSAFSVGGKYIRRWADGDLMRFTCSPVEASVVDFPALPSATFQVLKADGSISRRPFAPREMEYDMRKSDHSECEKRNRELSEHYTAISGLHKAAADHHKKMAAAASDDPLDRLREQSFSAAARGLDLSKGLGVDEETDLYSAFSK